jgi:hypothetical protein
MTSGGDTDGMEYEYEQIRAESGDAEDGVGIVADEDNDVELNENDPDPTAGGSDIGGRAAEPDPMADIDDGDLRGPDQHEVGGGQTGMGKGPTGS